MKAFLICPVRQASEESTDVARFIVKTYEERGYQVHWPPRDTDQVDDTGLRICKDNRKAIEEADLILVIWDGKSQGCLFDIGIAFALDKKIKVIDLPEKTKSKSYQNMIDAWEKDNE